MVRRKTAPRLASGVAIGATPAQKFISRTIWTRRPIWELQAAFRRARILFIAILPGRSRCKITIRGDGTAIVTSPTNDGFTPVSVNGAIYPTPPSILTNHGVNIDVQCCTGPPMVNSDGTAYLEYEVRNVVGEVVTSDTLYLMQINPIILPVPRY
jgi:hypothetical protein